MQRPDIFWHVTAQDAAPARPLEGDLRCDVAIVGGGFTGLRAALHLAEAGTSVAVFEAGDVGCGASGRSGGQVNPMLPVAAPDELRQAVGPKYFERMAQTALQSADDLFAFIRAYRIRCDARQNGWIRVDHCAKERQVARRNARLWNAHGADFTFLEREDVTRLTGAEGYRTGMLAARGGAVQPLSLLRGLDRAARAAGAQVYSHAPVSALTRKHGRWHLSVAGHRVEAEQVIIATNGYSDSLVPGLKGSVLPLLSIQMATGPLEDRDIGTILPEGHTISDTRRLIMYARRSDLFRRHRVPQALWRDWRLWLDPPGCRGDLSKSCGRPLALSLGRAGGADRGPGAASARTGARAYRRPGLQRARRGDEPCDGTGSGAPGAGDTCRRPAVSDLTDPKVRLPSAAGALCRSGDGDAAAAGPVAMAQARLGQTGLIRGSEVDI
jgi:glycine/D-amino acid oxidase-like deaminating enzyme